jgi:hypothetical protein
MFFGAEDLDSQASLLGMMAFFFACFGAGTPYWDDYAVAQNKNRQALAHRAFLAALPRRMLAHPRGGALAVIGHVERAWGYSFRWQGSEAEPESFKAVLFQLMKGLPVGHAMEHLNVRYAQIASLLSTDFEEVKFNPRYDPHKLGFHWLATNDARGYAILGDPAVKLPLAPRGEGGAARPEVEMPERRAGGLPVVLVLDSLPAAERAFVEKEIAAQPGAPAFAETGAGSEAKAPLPGADLPTAEQEPAPVQPILTAQEGGTPPQSVPSAYASALDGLAFALQSYRVQGSVNFSIGVEAVQFNILDDAKNAIKGVVENLNSALNTLSGQLLKAAQEVMTLEVTTSLVENLDTFDPAKPGEQKAKARFKTTISASGDIQVFLPQNAGPLDEVLLQAHKDMVEKAMSNRTETVKAIGELVASLFSPK